MSFDDTNLIFIIICQTNKQYKVQENLMNVISALLSKSGWQPMKILISLFPCKILWRTKNLMIN